MKKRLMSLLLTCAIFLPYYGGLRVYAEEEIAEVYVSVTSGSDTSGKGTYEKPYKTVKKAQNDVKKKIASFEGSEIRVVLREGEYPPITLRASSSGTEDVRVVFTAYDDERVVITNSEKLDPEDFVPVSEEDILKRLPEAARDKVRVLDLTKYGITSVPKLSALQNAQESPIGAGLFIDDTYTTTARWPDEGYIKLSDFAAIDEFTTGDGTSSITLKYNSDYYDFSRWESSTDAYLCGFFNYEYFFKYMALEKIASDKDTMSIKQIGTTAVRDEANMFFNNLLEELSAPGEWYLSEEDLKLYIYPPYDISSSTIRFVYEEGSSVYVKDGETANYTTIENMTLDGSYNCAVVLSGTGNAVKNCTIKNGCEDAVTISGPKSEISGNHVYNMGIGGVRTVCYQNPSINEADKNTNNIITNNKIHDYALIQRSYALGIYAYGVGGEISHNEIYNAPHTAISIGGVSTNIEYNDIHNVLTDAGDAAAIYIGGRWNNRGHNVRYNKIYNSYEPTVGGTIGIYLDDCASANNIIANVIDSMPGLGIYIHGGRDNVIKDNLVTNTFGSNTGTYEYAVGIAPVSDVATNMNLMMKQNPEFGDKTIFASYFEKWPYWAELFDGSDYSLPARNVICDNVFAGYGENRNMWFNWRTTVPSAWECSVRNNAVYKSAEGFYKDVGNGDLRYELPDGNGESYSFEMMGADNYYREWFLDDIGKNYDAELEVTIKKFPEYDNSLKGEYYGARFTINNRYCPITFSIEKDGIYYRNQSNAWVRADCDLEIKENVRYTYKVKTRGKSCEFYIDGKKQFDFETEVPTDGAANEDNMLVEYNLEAGVGIEFTLHSFNVSKVYRNEVIIDDFSKELTQRESFDGFVEEKLSNKLYSADTLQAIGGTSAGSSASCVYKLPYGYYITDFTVIHTHSSNNTGEVLVSMLDTSNWTTYPCSGIERSYIFGWDAFRYAIKPNDSYKAEQLEENRYSGLYLKMRRTVDKENEDYPKLLRVIVEYKQKDAEDKENPVTIYSKNYTFESTEEALVYLKSSTTFHNNEPYISASADGLTFSNGKGADMVKLPVSKIGLYADGNAAYADTRYAFLNTDGVFCTISENKQKAEFANDGKDTVTAICASYDKAGRLVSVETKALEKKAEFSLEKSSAAKTKLFVWDELKKATPLDKPLIVK